MISQQSAFVCVSISFSECQTEIRKEPKIPGYPGLQRTASEGWNLLGFQKMVIWIDPNRKLGWLASPIEKHYSRKILINSINWF